MTEPVALDWGDDTDTTDTADERTRTERAQAWCVRIFWPCAIYAGVVTAALTAGLGVPGVIEGLAGAIIPLVIFPVVILWVVLFFVNGTRNSWGYGE